MINTYLRLVLIILLTAVLCTTGCKKEDQDTISRYELRFTNTSDNPYLVEVDGSSAILHSHTFKDYDLERGTYAWKVTQQSGYILYPTVREGTVNLDREKEVVFP